MKAFEPAETASDSYPADRRRGVWIENDDVTDEDRESPKAPRTSGEVEIRLPGYREFQEP
jgi:hypothetical protein